MADVMREKVCWLILGLQFALNVFFAAACKVYYTGFFDGDADPPVKFVDGVMHVRDEASEWMPIR